MKPLASGRALCVLTLLLASAHARAQAVVTHAGGALSSPIAGDFDISGIWGWPARAAANGVELGETAGCITFRGPTADAFEVRMCGADSLADGILNLIAVSGGNVELRSPGNIGFSPAGAYKVVQVEGTVTGSLRMRTDTVVCFTSGLPEDACDTGFRRDATGVIRGFSGSATTAMGVFKAGLDVEDVATTKTPTEAECGETYTNNADVDGLTITLLDNPPKGCHFHFGIADAITSNTFTITAPSGESIRYAGSTCTSLTATATGTALHLVSFTAGSGAKWVPNGSTGTWTCVP